jgi:predicted CXXCH cytochrome family protein
MLRFAYYSFRMIVTAAAVCIFSGGIASGKMVRHYGFNADADGGVSHCVSCHDGVIGKNVQFCIGECNSEYPHPVLRRYPPPGKEHLFAPAAVVAAKGIKLPEGRTACVSCHDLANKEKYNLVMDNRGSRLCLSCHINR